MGPHVSTRSGDTARHAADCRGRRCPVYHERSGAAEASPPPASRHRTGSSTQGQTKDSMTAQSAAGQSITEHSPRDGFDALLIIGHGTRDPEGLAEFRYLVDQVARQRTDWHVTGCCLELAEPSIAVAVDRLAVSGRSRIRAMPLVLFSAGHAKRDIPDALAQAIARNPGVEIELCPPLGCNPAIVELSTERCQQAIFGHSAISPDETLLILVGRGSSDAEALRRCGNWPTCGGAARRRTGSPISRIVCWNRVVCPTQQRIPTRRRKTLLWDFRTLRSVLRPWQPRRLERCSSGRLGARIAA